jgi:hypothetical protein
VPRHKGGSPSDRHRKKMEEPRGQPFSYIKALAFSLRLEGKKQMKSMV